MKITQEGWDTLKKMYAHLYAICQEAELPRSNYYAFVDHMISHDSTLRNNTNYLLILASAWCPMDVILASHSFTNLTPYFFSEMNSGKYSDYHKLFPNHGATLMDLLFHYEHFSRLTSAATGNLLLRMNDYNNLFKNYRQRKKELDKWIKRYESFPKSGQAYSSAVFAAKEKFDARSVYRLLLIFQEYIHNLLVDSKNRKKYTDAYKNVGNTIKFMGKYDLSKNPEILLKNTVICNFYMLLAFVKNYKPYSEVGPMYLYWKFKLGISKLTARENLSNSFFNLDMNVFASDDPVNSDWHERCPSIADQARIYLFDTLCDFWKKVDDCQEQCEKAINLSKYMFEMKMPFYHEFMKYGRPSAERIKVWAEEKEDHDDEDFNHVEYKYIHYNQAEFTNFFLQTAVKCISNNLIFLPGVSELFPLINESEWAKLVKGEKPQLGLFFSETKAILEDFDPTVKPRFMHMQFENKVEEVASQDRNVREFEQLYFFSSEGLGSKPSDDWFNRRDLYFETVYMEVKDELELKFKPTDDHAGERAELLYDLLEKEAFLISQFGAILFPMKILYKEYMEKMMEYSKQALFREYSPEQHKKLEDFVQSYVRPLLNQLYLGQKR